MSRMRVAIPPIPAVRIHGVVPVKKGCRGTFLHLHLQNVMITRDLVTCVTLISFVH